MAAERNTIASVACDFLCAGVYAPLFSVLARFQTQREMIRLAPPGSSIDGPYRGLYDCASRLVASHGWPVLWRGVAISTFLSLSAPFLRARIAQSIKASRPPPGRASDENFLTTLDSMVAICVTEVILYPLEVLRFRAMFKEDFSIINEIVKDPRSLYHGYLARLLYLLISRVFLATVVGCLPRNTNPRWLFISSIIPNTIISHPFVITTRYMQLHAMLGKVESVGVVECMERIVEREGYGGFFKGAGALVMLTLLHAMFREFMITTIKKILRAR